MLKNLNDCLHNNVPGEYILPFFWQHGEEKERLYEEMLAIKNSGICEFCVESRTHEQFCEDKWWDDFGFILESAEKLGMRVWILDDKHFPTGYANNYIASHPENRTWSLRCDYRDFVGPQIGTSLLAVECEEEDEEEYLSITAYMRDCNGNNTGTYIDLTDKVSEGLIRWDIPAGLWRVFYVYKSRHTVRGRENYINMVDIESCRSMVHAVYDPHYEHYKEHFGKTIAGFFSDEPSFSNDGCHYYSELGRDFVLLPWTEGFENELSLESGIDRETLLRLLPMLWENCGEKTAKIRESYMQSVTKAYSKNFNIMLGEWCREHGVMYIGHIIEDMNIHQRLGASAGHFFRSMAGQDMSGIDIVLHQIIPGFNDINHRACIAGETADPAFFRDTLPKLGASLAHIDPLKKGRAMCEIFGAFGWAEGLWEMKHMTDMMLSGGINYFVPHAFSPKYPDDDCPPHFYAGGKNPQFSHFKFLMDYMKRSAHLMTGGIHRAGIALYYNAEAEWCGGKHHHISDVCPTLVRNQVDFDIIPADYLINFSSVEEGKLKINKEEYSALVVPYSEILPRPVLDRMAKLSASGLKLIFTEAKPSFDTEMNVVTSMFEDDICVPTNKLLDVTTEYKTVTTEYAPDLRVLRMDMDKSNVFMLWNSNIFSEFTDYVDFGINKKAYLYDAWDNKCFNPQTDNGKVKIRLAPNESIFVVFTEENETFPDFDYRDKEMKELIADWKVSVMEAGEKEFSPLKEGSPTSVSEIIPSFSGTIKYRAEFDVSGVRPEYLEITSLSESCELKLNDIDLGIKVSAPFRFNISDALKDGANRLEITILTNPGRREKDWFSTFLPIPAAGITGKVLIG